MGRREPGDAPTTPALVAVLLLGLVVAVVTLTAWVVNLPRWVVVAGGVLLVAGMVLTAVLTFRAARTAGRSVGGVLWATVRAPIRFLLDFAF